MTKPEQLPFDLGHRHAHERENFWVSASNADAVAWIDKWPDWPAPALILYGPAASGKTHLLQVWRQEAGAVEIAASNITAESAGNAKAVIIDDIQSIMGDNAREQALFHTYNMMRDRGGHMLLAAEKPVRDWNIQLPDLKSRLMAAPAVGIGSPDDELIAVVLTKMFSDRQIFVSQEVVQFILPRIERSFHAVRDLVEKTDHRAMAEKRAITIPLVREILDR